MTVLPVNKKLQNLELRAREKTEAAQVKKVEKLQRQKVGRLSREKNEQTEISSRPIWNCYIESAKAHNIIVPGWERKEMAIAKRFAQKVGSMERAIKIVEYIFEHWTELVKKWKLQENSSPTISVISTFGLSLANTVSQAARNKNNGFGIKAIVSYTGGKDER